MFSRSQGYGLTETNSAVTAIGGPDYALRPKSMYVTSFPKHVRETDHALLLLAECLVL